MNALVTGGGGFLGLYITEQLVARGDTVRVLCRGRHCCLDELGVEWMPGDVRDANAVSRACQGVETVFHVAAIPGIWGSKNLFHSVNTQGTLNVVEGCRAHGVTRLVYTSTASVAIDAWRAQCGNDDGSAYPKKYLCHYPHSKALAEQAVLAANGKDGLSTVSLRPHLIWGPRDNHLVPRLIARARAGRLWRIGSGDNHVSMSYVENVAAGHVQAADALARDARAAGKAYFIVEQQPVNLWAWIDDLLARAGLPRVVKQMSAEAGWRLGATMEFLYRLLRVYAEPPMTRFLAGQLSNTYAFSSEGAQRDFGYAPVVSVKEGMRRLEPELKQLAHRDACGTAASA